MDFGGRSPTACAPKPQNEVKTGGDFFRTLYADPKRLEEFLKAMTGLSVGTARAIMKKFPWKKYQSFVDVGCAQGGVAAEIALAHKHLIGGGMDLPVVQPLFEAYAKSRGVQKRMRFHPNFFKSPCPTPTSLSWATSCTIGIWTRS
ncbi:MAG: methyltransferase [Nitrospiraceae bacterium]